MQLFNIEAYPAPGSVKSVALIGTGSVGKSWATLYLARGYEVRTTDPQPDFAEDLRTFVRDAWQGVCRLYSAAPLEPPFERLACFATAEEAARDADLVHENAPENASVKCRLIAQLDAVMPPDRLILSSTGGIGPTVLQSTCRHPARVLVAHPFNPPHLIPLVEIVGGAATDPAAVQWTRLFMRHLGKRPIVLKREVAGHLANRLQAALLREAFHCLVEDIASPQDIDDAVRYGLGLRWALMGGLLTFHLAGGPGGAQHTLDLAGDAFERWWADLGDIHLTPDVRAKIIAGTAEIAGDRSIGDWAQWRDHHLIDIINQLGLSESTT